MFQLQYTLNADTELKNKIEEFVLFAERSNTQREKQQQMMQAWEDSRKKYESVVYVQTGVYFSNENMPLFQAWK